MKKLLIAALLVLGIATAPFAQQATKKGDTTAHKMAKTEKKEATKKATAAGTKADGTPDMRLKANKAKAVPADTTKKLKKNGTPDMRYKANKKKP